MNYREPPLSLAAARRALLWMALSLLPALAPLCARTLPSAASSHGDPPARSVPYLVALGSTRLHFQEPIAAAVPNDPPPFLVAPTPTPVPLSTPAPTPATDLNPVSSASGQPAKETPVSEPTDTRKEPPKEARPPASILPDDVRPTYRPEDALQYFQIPGSAGTPGDVTLVTPVPRSAPGPAPLPPSSATYRTTP